MSLAKPVRLLRLHHRRGRRHLQFQKAEKSVRPDVATRPARLMGTTDRAAVRAARLATQDDIQTITLSRDTLARCFSHPRFSQIIHDAYVRIGIGSVEGHPVYRLARIVRVAESSAPNRNLQTTDLQLTLAIGTVQKDLAMATVSNATFTKVGLNLVA